MIKECESFFVWYTGEGVIRIFPFQVDDQLSEFMIFTELVDRICQGLPADYCREISVRFAVPAEHCEMCDYVKEP